MANPTLAIRVVATVAELKKSLAEGKAEIVTTTAAMAKLATSFQGDKLVQHAHNVTAAIHSVGVSALNAKEAARQLDVLERAMAKMEATAKPIPPAMASTAASLKQVIANAQPPQASAITKWWGDFTTQALATATGFLTAQTAINVVSGAWSKLTGFLKDSVQSAAAADAAQRKLEAALRQHGTATPQVIAQYGAMAAQFQRTTVYSDDLTNEMQALLVQVGGVMPSQMRGALVASTDLASGLGIDLQQATMLVAKAAAGHTESLGRYGIQVSDAELKSKGFAAVLEAVNRQFGGQAQAEAASYAGRLAQLANAWDNVKEAVGRKIIQDPLVIAALEKLTASAGSQAEALDASSAAAETWTSKLTGMAQAAVGFLNPGYMLLSLFVQTARDMATTSVIISDASRTIQKNYDDIAARAGDQTSQRIMAAGMAESARLADQDAQKKKEAAAATAKLHEAQARFAQNLREVTQASRSHLQTLDSIDGAMVEGARYYAQRGVDLQKVGDMYGLTATQVRVLADQFKHEADVATFNARVHVGLGKELATVGATVVPLGARALPQFTVGLQGAAAAASNLAGRSTALGKQLKTDLLGVLQSVPQLLSQALTGGGGLVGALSAIGSQAGAAFGKFVGKGISALGKFGGPIGEAVGALAGPLIEKLFSIGGPSKLEMAGRDAAKQFAAGIAASLSESQIAEAGTESWRQTVVGVRDAYLAVGRTAAQAEAAVARMWAAERAGPAAVAALTREMQAVVDQARRLREAAARFGPSRAELQQLAADAKATYDYMLASGQYTAEQLAAAMTASQEAQATALGINTAAQQANMAALQKGLTDLMAQRDQVWQQIANEAPEEVMGVIEAGQRAQIATLDAQIADQRAKMAAQAEEYARELEAALADIQPATVHVPVVWDVSDFPGSPAYEVPEPQYMARGGFGTVDTPTLFVAGEAGREQFAFSGANRTFEQVGGIGGDVSGIEQRLDRLLAQTSRQSADLFLAIRDGALLRRGR